MAYKLSFKSSVKKDLKKIDIKIAKQIIEKLETDLCANPGKHKMLTGRFSGLYSYRFSDYRAIYSLIDSELIFLVLFIGHRKSVYKEK